MATRLLYRSGAVLGAAGVVLLSLGIVGRGDARPEVLVGNYPVNRSALDPGDLGAHNSPTVVQNPRDPSNLVVVNRVDRPDFGCAVHTSSDGGRTFEPSALPVPEGEKCFAPDAAFGSDGYLHVVFVTLEGFANVPAAVWLTRSSDGGLTFEPARRVLGPLSFQVRIAVAPDDPKRLYLTWLAAGDVAILAFPEPGYPLMLSRSGDGGLTWSEPVRLSAPDRQRVVAPAPLALSSGEVVVAYLDLGDDRLDYHGGHQGADGPPYHGTWQLVVARSTDAGRSFTQTIAEDALVPSERFIPFLPPFPAIAAGVGDDLYVAFHDGRTGDADVYLWSSRDRGVTFEEPVRVNDTPMRDGSTQRLPKVAVASDGRVDVVYYDQRAHPGADLTEVSLQQSFDGGRSFGRRLAVSDRAFPARVGPGLEDAIPDLGSRIGLLSSPGRVLVAWADTRAGSQVSGKQDIVRAVVRMTGSPPLPSSVLRGLQGVGLLLLGGALVATALARRRRIAEPSTQDAAST
jgi:hypothetical protein